MQLSIATLALGLAALSAAWAPLRVDAYPRFVAKLPNGASVKGIVALGHANRAEGGGERNPFGQAFAGAGFRWSTELCQADSDGDGQTNGQELGDPCCSWVETGNLAYIRDISDPSDPASTVNPIIFKGIQCTKSEAAVEAANRQAKKTKKPKATKPAPTKRAVADDGEDESGSGSSSGKNLQGKDSAPKAISAAHGRTTATATATALTVGVALAWVVL